MDAAVFSGGVAEDAPSTGVAGGAAAGVDGLGTSRHGRDEQQPDQPDAT